MPKRIVEYVKKSFLLIFLLCVVISIIDIIRIITYEVYPSLPENDIITLQDEIYAQLVSEKEFIEWNKLEGTLQYIENEYDVSDFKLVNLIRILYEYEEIVPLDTRRKVDSVLLNFRYWMDDSGENSMCYWSENHQILFSSAEYLIGQFYADSLFNRSNLTGIEHQQKAKKRILDWLELRWLYGFTEFYSGTYYVEDVAALLNLIDHAQDEEIVQKSKIILDLLFYDIATQSFQGTMVSVSGRAYEINRKGGGYENLGGIVPYLLNELDTPIGMVYALSRTKNYEIPSVFKEIGNDSTDVIILQSNGLNINELKKENLFGESEKNIMMQWGMESFTNKEIINNSLKYIKKNSMFSNEFLKDFRYLDFTLLSIFNLQSVLSDIINPSINGKAIERGNTYTYKTNQYSLYSVQNYHPGDYADQHHIAGMNIGNSFSIYHTHPARKPNDFSHSPNYWVGYGRLPHVVQDKNVCLAIYNLPSKKNITEKYLLDYTHAYFPTEKFDSVYVFDNYVFGKQDDVYCALIGSDNMEFVAKDDVIQKSTQSVWIMEGGSQNEYGSFDHFIEKISNNPFSFDKNDLTLLYSTNNKNYKLTFSGSFHINNKIIDTEYIRFDSPYIQANRKANTFDFSFNGKSLHLDFYNQKREMN